MSEGSPKSPKSLFVSKILKWHSVTTMPTPKGRYRAARAAKNTTTTTKDGVIGKMIFDQYGSLLIMNHGDDGVVDHVDDQEVFVQAIEDYLHSAEGLSIHGVLQGGFIISLSLDINHDNDDHGDDFYDCYVWHQRCMGPPDTKLPVPSLKVGCKRPVNSFVQF